MKQTRIFSTLMVLLGTLPAWADGPRATLPQEQRTNGKQTLAAVAKLQPQTTACTALIESAQRGDPICTATIVGEDGYLLTKASEVPDTAKVRVRFADGRAALLREIRREVRLDLVLVQAVGITGLRPVLFGEAKPLVMGQWLCSTASEGKEPRIGIVSARSRRIPGTGAALGIRMQERSGETKGVRIIGIASESPAEAAGLHEGDVIVTVAGEAVAQYRRVHEIVSKRQPGEVIEVRYMRKAKEETCQVRLASRTKVLQNWEGEDFANGGISLRSDNFPEVLQHDIPLHPSDMGGPVATLEGKVVGINIARVDRVTTFALPVEVFWGEVQQWIKADRHPPKAVSVER